MEKGQYRISVSDFEGNVLFTTIVSGKELTAIEAERIIEAGINHTNFVDIVDDEI
jgi:hypothetical protein